MKKTTLLLIVFPFFLNAQNEQVKNWHFHFNYQFENIHAFNGGNADFFDFEYYEIDKSQPAIGHTIQLGLTQYLNEKIGFQYNLNYANRNLELITYGNGGNIFGPTIVLDGFGLSNFDWFANVLLVEANSSHLELEASFFWEKKFNKFGITTNAGVGGNYYLKLETEALDIEPFSITYGEKIETRGNLKPKGIIPFAKVQAGVFYDYSERTRFFLQPFYRMDILKTKSDLFDHRFSAFGGKLGVSIKI